MGTTPSVVAAGGHLEELFIVGRPSSHRNGASGASGGCSTGDTSPRPLHPIGSEEALALFDPVDSTILQTVVSSLRP